jgi:hypothetical protein
MGEEPDLDGVRPPHGGMWICFVTLRTGFASLPHEAEQRAFLHPALAAQIGQRLGLCLGHQDGERSGLAIPLILEQDGVAPGPWLGPGAAGGMLFWGRRPARSRRWTGKRNARSESSVSRGPATWARGRPSPHQRPVSRAGKSCSRSSGKGSQRWRWGWKTWPWKPLTSPRRNASFGRRFVPDGQSGSCWGQPLSESVLRDSLEPRLSTVPVET